MELTQCEGYRKLLAAVERDEKRSPGFHDYRGKLSWIVERTKHYAEVTGLEASEILDAWEKHRRCWYMNYYQECNQPLLSSGYIRVFESSQDLQESVGAQGFRCPACEGVSMSPYECDSGLKFPSGKTCDWKSWGLFGTLGRGTFVFVKEKMRGEWIFTPLAWEKNQ